MQTNSALFNKTHNDVKIDWTNAGAGGDEYTKLQTALKAGKGAPDVAMIESTTAIGWSMAR